MSVLPSRLAPVLGLLGVIIFAALSAAQAGDGKVGGGSTRAELTGRARIADSLGRKDEAFSIRRRLRDGDFEVGDRIVFWVQLLNSVNVPANLLNLPSPADSLFTVQAGKILPLPEPLGNVDLNGVLRSELRDTLVARVATQFRNAVVHVSALLRLSISGAVVRAGPAYVRPDMPLGDFIVRTGGSDPTADLRNTIIRRGDEVFWKAEDVQTALTDGLTLEQLNLEPGDEVVVGAKHGNNLALLMQVGASLVSAVILQLLLRHK